MWAVDVRLGWTYLNLKIKGNGYKGRGPLGHIYLEDICMCVLCTGVEKCRVTRWGTRAIVSCTVGLVGYGRWVTKSDSETF